MGLTFSHLHTLGADEARRRLVGEAASQGVEVRFDPVDPNAGFVTASSSLGKASARFVIRETALDIDVFDKPAFVPAGLVRSALEAGLQKLLGDCPR